MQTCNKTPKSKILIERLKHHHFLILKSSEASTLENFTITGKRSPPSNGSEIHCIFIARTAIFIEANSLRKKANATLI